MSYIEFPYVLVAKGKPQTLFSVRDYEDVLREYIGEDAVQFFRQATEDAVQFFRQATEDADAKIKELEDAVDYLEEELLLSREALR